jgi:signal transduction histidine kinase
VVAYAGFPVHAPSGEVLGALCVVDLVPRTWTSAHLSGLQHLATAVDTKIALRLSRREVHLDHERLMHVLDGAAHTLIIICDVAGVIRKMNRAAEAAFGPVERVGTRTLSGLAGGERPWDHGGGLGEAQDWTLSPPYGEQSVFSVRVNALRDPEGEVVGYIVVADDVSARRRSEDLLRDTVGKQAEAVEHLEALEAQRSTFIETVSHELRTPVTSILGYTELLADGECGDLTPPQHDLVSRLVRNGRRLQHLIEDLLTLDRIESGEVGPDRTEVDVKLLAQQAWDGLQTHLAGRDLRTTMELAPDIAGVSGDQAQLGRALLNLLTNAVKFTPDGGAVRLSVWTDPRGVTFEVRDTGHGISQDDLDAVFEPFFRTRDAHLNAVPGSGIGLAVVRRIIEAHGGEIALDSVVGRGTEVRFTIPAWTTSSVSQGRHSLADMTTPVVHLAGSSRARS